MDRVQNSYVIIAKKDLYIIRGVLLKIFFTLFDESFNCALLNFCLAKGLNAVMSFVYKVYISF